MLTSFFEFVGTVAFAISGAMVAIEKKMDILGIAVLGITTSVGGGVFRDLMLGNTPPQAFTKPLYIIVATVVSVIIFIPAVRERISRKKERFDLILLVMDSVGLSVFTVVGINVARDFSQNYFLIAFVGVLTGVGGGILRDVMAQNTPFIFRKHFYCCAAIIGATVATVLGLFIGNMFSLIIGAVLIFVLRLLAAHYRWKLPRVR